MIGQLRYAPVRVNKINGEWQEIEQIMTNETRMEDVDLCYFG